MKRISLIFLFSLLFTTAFAQKSWDLKHFPEGSRPEEIGKKLVEHYLDTRTPIGAMSDQSMR